MSTGTRHTAKAFDQDMDHIRGLIAEMGARAETAVGNSMKALIENDKSLAQTTRADDKIIDRLETEVEQRVVQTIALRAPMADDLRELVAALKIAAVIERIGDYAKNISKRVGQLETSLFLQTNDQLRLMGDIAGEMVRNAINAYAARDIELATATEVAHLLYISKNLERVGDHATNWAHMIYFTETGENLPEE
jgi:phosphate transport system protein